MSKRRQRSSKSRAEPSRRGDSGQKSQEAEAARSREKKRKTRNPKGVRFKDDGPEPASPPVRHHGPPVLQAAMVTRSRSRSQPGETKGRKRLKSILKRGRDDVPPGPEPVSMSRPPRSKRSATGADVVEEADVAIGGNPNRRASKPVPTRGRPRAKVSHQAKKALAAAEADFVGDAGRAAAPPKKRLLQGGPWAQHQDGPKEGPEDVRQIERSPKRSKKKRSRGEQQPGPARSGATKRPKAQKAVSKPKPKKNPPKPKPAPRARRAAAPVVPRGAGPKKLCAMRERMEHARSYVGPNSRSAASATKRSKKEESVRVERLRAAQDQKDGRLRRPVSRTPTPASVMKRTPPSTSSARAKKKKKGPQRESLGAIKRVLEVNASISSDEPSQEEENIGPCGENWTQAAKKLKISFDQAKEFDAWVQHNRKPKGKPHLTRLGMKDWLKQKHQVDPSDRSLSGALHELGYTYEEPKVTRFEINRALEAVKQHLQRKVVFQELLESRPDLFELGYHDEKTPTTTIKSQKVWTKKHGSSAMRANPDVGTGKGPGLNISAVLDVTSKRFVRDDQGHMVGNFNESQARDEAGAKKTENNYSFRRVLSDAGTRMQDVHPNRVVVLPADAPNLHIGATSSTVLQPSSMNLKKVRKGSDPKQTLEAVLEEEGLWEEGMRKKEALEAYKGTESYLKYCMDRISDAEVECFSSGIVVLFQVNSRPEFNTIENYWRAGDAKYIAQGKPSITTLRDSWWEFMSSGGGDDPDFDRRHDRSQQLRRFALRYPDAERKNEADLKRKNTTTKLVDGVVKKKEKWRPQEAPHEKMAALSEMLGLPAPQEEPFDEETLQMVRNTVFAYAHYLNTVRLHNRKDFQLDLAPDFNFEAMWPRWQSLCEEQLRRLEELDAPAKAAWERMVTGTTERKEAATKRKKQKVNSKAIKVGKTDKKPGNKKAKKAYEPESAWSHDVDEETKILNVSRRTTRSAAAPSTDAAQPLDGKSRAAHVPAWSMADLLYGDDESDAAVAVAESLPDPAFDRELELQNMSQQGIMVSNHLVSDYLELLESQQNETDVVKRLNLNLFHAIAITDLGGAVPTPEQDQVLLQRVGSVKRKGKFPQAGILILPAFVHGNHFITVTVDIDAGIVRVFDSLEGNGPSEAQMARIIFFLSGVTPQNDWMWFTPDTPQQAPGSNDCALCTLSFVRSLIESEGTRILSKAGFSTMKKDVKGNQKIGAALRKRMVTELRDQELRAWK